MKTRVLSIRISYDTIALCYLLQQKTGIDPTNKPVSTVVSETITGLIKSARQFYMLPELDEEDAGIVLEEFVSDKLPGFDAFAPVELRFAQNQAEREKPGQTEPDEKTKSVLAQAASAIPIEKEEVKVSTEEFSPEVVMPTVAPVSVEDAIEQAAQIEVAKQEQELLQSMSLGSIARVSPQAVAPKPICPWKNTALVDIDEKLEKDKLYQESLKIDELMVIAVRSTYNALSENDWSTPIAVKMIKQTYKLYKGWKEKYGE